MTDPRPGSDAPDAPGLGPWRSDPVPEGFVPFPVEALRSTVIRRFLEVAAASPDRPALTSPSGNWTYGELDAAVRTQGGAIRRLLGGERRPVAILAAHDGPLVVAILAVLAAGGIVVVLDPMAPPEQTEQVLAESGAPLLLHDAAHADAASALGRVGAAPTSLDGLTGEPIVEVADDGPGTPIMLAFTSGTSGAPKAATITDGVLLNLVRGAADAFGIGPDDRMPMLFPTSLAVAAYPMFLPLLTGGSLATLDVRSVGLAPIGPFLIEERITVAYMAPTVVRFLVGSLDGLDFPDLRLVALGGELVDAEVVALTIELLGPELVANGFGTTETGVIALYVLDPAAPPSGVVPAGYPVPDVDLHILDEHGAPVPVGVAGEVAISSPHVFAGYWGHEELSSQVLAPDPDGRDGWHLYRTGDLGSLDAHGALTVQGRLDTKVKVRGRFVVLGDVEAAVHELPEVADAVVVPARVDEVVELAAVVAPVPGAEVSGPELRSALLDGHEAYRVPSRWWIVDELPRLPNGKVDRRAVADLVERDLDARRPEPGAPATAATPRRLPPDEEATPLQASLQRLWQRLLPVGPVGLDEDFFHLGGHSLLAAQMLVMLEQEHGIAVPMSALVDARTVRQVAEVVERIERANEADPTTAACVQRGDGSLPRLWFVHDLPGSAYRARHLAAHLGEHQPVWSFDSPLLRGEPNRFRTLRELAGRYVSDLRAAQPAGPYWLAGYSFGGIAAYEMARQLVAAGEEVAFVGVVDVGPGYRGPSWDEGHSPPWPYFGVPHPPASEASLADAARHYVEMVRTSPLGAARHLTLRTGLARRIDAARFARDLREHGRVRPEWRLWYAWEEHWRLASREWDRSSRYDGRVDLFWASQTGSSDASMGWEPLVGELHVHRFAGTHEEILEPGGAPALAAALRAVLDERRAPDHRG